MELQSKEIQSIDVELNHSPMLLTGINMGGKTLVLRTLALAQLLTQFGFFVPAESAHVVLVKQVLGSMEDNQDQQHGLSSYAAEMKRIDHILKVSKQIQPCLVLVDELARTTNPTEGRALVSAFLQLMSQRSHFTVLTSHYDGIDARCERWRVKGLKAGADWGIQSLGDAIDYRLVRDDSEHAPQEALKIATLLDVDQELISLAKTLVTK